MHALIASAAHHVIEIAGAGALAVVAWPAGVATVAGGLLGGWAVGSFAEYGLHVHVLHGRGAFAAAHRRHHARAEEIQLDAGSFFAPLLLQALFGLLAFLATGNGPLAMALAAGAMLQYSWFRAVHRLMHERPSLAGLRPLREFHEAHHRRSRCNFGVTTRFWDTVFGTAAGGEGAAKAMPPLHGQDIPVAVDDPRPASDAPRNALERRALHWLRDPRDLAFVRLGLQASVLLVPAAALLYAMPGWLAALFALPYWWLLYARYGGPVLLMVHALFHRRTFQGRGRWIDRFLRHVLPMLYGLQPFAYFPQHVLMHHAQDNRGEDLSSTLGLRRDRWQDFLRYWLRFMGPDNFRLAAYLARRGQQRALAGFVAGSLAWFAAVGWLLLVAPAATLVVFVAPYLLTRFFLMAGNWAQHAFVDPDATDARLGDATILLNAAQNRRCFNDGYHAVHHRRPGLHWAEMSASFVREWRHYAAHRVLVFDGVPNNQVVWWRLMRRDYGYLADRLADFGWLPAGREQRIRLLRERVAASPRSDAAAPQAAPGAPSVSTRRTHDSVPMSE